MTKRTSFSGWSNWGNCDAFGVTPGREATLSLNLHLLVVVQHK